MPRKFKAASITVDYTYQLVDYLHTKWNKLGNLLFSWRFEFLDKHCNCNKCRKRRWENGINVRF